ncbi:MAG: hypothetical protein CMJ50_10485, partial [Planctomycetaceae bacterium]|nr:hypothetical protein [Planctomycetaceae bacterium]
LRRQRNGVAHFVADLLPTRMNPVKSRSKLRREKKGEKGRKKGRKTQTLKRENGKDGTAARWAAGIG